jgi:hypothetical protein
MLDSSIPSPSGADLLNQHLSASPIGEHHRGNVLALHRRVSANGEMKVRVEPA